MEAMGLKPDKITHHFMVMTFAKAGVFKMADNYIQEMMGRNELPTMEMYNDLVTEACVRNLSMLVGTPAAIACSLQTPHLPISQFICRIYPSGH